MGGLVGQCWVSALLTRYQLPGSGVPLTVGDSPRVKKTISRLRGTVLRTKYYFCSVLLWCVDVAESAVPVLIKPLKIFPPPVTGDHPPPPASVGGAGGTGPSSDLHTGGGPFQAHPGGSLAAAQKAPDAVTSALEVEDLCPAGQTG